MSKLPVIGEKYLMRAFPNLGLPNLHTIKVVNIVKLGDGTVVVRYRRNHWPFHIYDDMELGEFMGHIEDQNQCRS